MIVFGLSMAVPYIWYLAVGASIIFPGVFLIRGAFNLGKGGNSLIGFAGIFLMAALIVGFGTCMVNMSGM